MSNESELQIEVEAAINEAGITSFEVNDSDHVISEIRKIYVEGNPRVWWLSLKHRKSAKFFCDDSGYITIPACIKELYGDVYDLSKRVYFVVDEDEDGVENSLLVYRVPLDKVPEIIGNCYFFEYYVVALDYSWLIVENHHAEVIVCQYE